MIPFLWVTPPKVSSVRQSVTPGPPVTYDESAVCGAFCRRGATFFRVLLVFGSTGNNIQRRKTDINHSLCNEILSFHATAARSFLYEGDEMKYEINTVLLIVGLSTGTLCTRSSNFVFNMLLPVYLIFRVSKYGKPRRKCFSGGENRTCIIIETRAVCAFLGLVCW